MPETKASSGARELANYITSEFSLVPDVCCSVEDQREAEVKAKTELAALIDSALAEMVAAAQAVIDVADPKFRFSIEGTLKTALAKWRVDSGEGK